MPEKRKTSIKRKEVLNVVFIIYSSIILTIIVHNI